MQINTLWDTPRKLTWATESHEKTSVWSVLRVRGHGCSWPGAVVFRRVWVRASQGRYGRAAQKLSHGADRPHPTQALLCNPMHNIRVTLSHAWTPSILTRSGQCLVLHVGGQGCVKVDDVEAVGREANSVPGGFGGHSVQPEDRIFALGGHGTVNKV